MVSAARLGLVLALVAVGGGCEDAAPERPAPAYQSGPGAVPENLVQMALREAETYDGFVDDVYAEASTDLTHLREVEPSNSFGLEDEPGDIPVHAVFFVGELTVQGPPSGGKPSPTSAYRAGRVLLVGDRVLSVQLWNEPRDADPPFGPRFDDG